MITITKTWSGYEIVAPDPYSKIGRLYVSKVYGGRVTWASDEAHAKKYKSIKTAEVIAKKIAKGYIV